MSAVFENRGVPVPGPEGALVASYRHVDDCLKEENLYALHDALCGLEPYKDAPEAEAALYEYVRAAHDKLLTALRLRYLDLVASSGPGNKEALQVLARLREVDPALAEDIQGGSEKTEVAREKLFREYFPDKAGKHDLSGYASEDSDDGEERTFRTYDCTPDANQVLQRVKKEQVDASRRTDKIGRDFDEACAPILDGLRACADALVETVTAHTALDERVGSAMASFDDTLETMLKGTGVTEDNRSDICKRAKAAFAPVAALADDIETCYSRGSNAVRDIEKMLASSAPDLTTVRNAVSRVDRLRDDLCKALAQRDAAYKFAAGFQQTLCSKEFSNERNKGAYLRGAVKDLEKMVAGEVRNSREKLSSGSLADWGVHCSGIKELVKRFDDEGAKVARLAAEVKEGQEIGIAQVYHEPAWTVQEEKDFLAARAAFANQDLKALKALKTRFFIAQYRGITYNTYRFTPIERRNSREKFETRLPTFSPSVFVEVGISAERYYDGQYDETVDARLLQYAEELRGVLLEKRKSGPVETSGYRYENAGEALQDLYTNNYDRCFALIGEYLRQQATARSGEEAPGKAKGDGDEWKLWDGLFNAANPMVSTGDMPRHALKYAYGMKAYGGHENEILNPNWDADGNTVWPYAGKVFAYLFTLEDYLKAAPLHVTSLNLNGRIKVALAIAEERETTFPAFIERDRVAAEHVAKYPSFPGSDAGDGYDPKIHLQKYGLVREDFLQFHAGVRTDDVQRSGAYRNIASWLVNYHEARLIELMRRMAKQRGGLLVYRDDLGNLSKGLMPIGNIHAVRTDAHTGKTVAPMVMRTGRTSEFKNAAWITKFLSSRTAPPALRTVLQFDAAVAVRGIECDVPSDGNCLFYALGGGAVRSGTRDRRHR
ncbi:hypothetical protein HH212_18625 [Massilia forsythiae]|uniref:Uncharacterized protein n=1 Tax=Massilia forsythiae TaxID=2728020 RepID=A0A7Z2ZTW5_9BURK|nr:hypothetical protein [Massilia forsythiae]QJE01794.1 hypothetical protein HH212_18625 [Massilia forsythiae]